MRTTSKILSILLILWSYGFSINSDAAEQECVILLHGLTRSHNSLGNLESTLKKHHYIVINQDYPTTTKSIKELANSYIQPMIDQCSKYNAHSINFVTHSLGGIVLQVYLQNHKLPKLGRIVMLSPPNHGSQIANLLQNIWLYQMITGPAGQELTTFKTSTPHRLHLSHQYQIGIIAGTFTFVPFINYLFHDANDGIVSVSSTRTKIMKDFIVLPVSHSFMMDNACVEEQILSFLSSGKFIHPS